MKIDILKTNKFYVQTNTRCKTTTYKVRYKNSVLYQNQVKKFNIFTQFSTLSC